MSRSPRLWAPGYLVAFFLVAAPLNDLVLRLRPLDPSSLEWRYGSIGFVSLSLEAPFLGILLALIVAAVLGHKRTVQVLSVVALVASVGLLGLGGLFALDAQQLRSMIDPLLRPSFSIGALIALVKFGVGACVAGLLGWSGLRRAERR